MPELLFQMCLGLNQGPLVSLGHRPTPQTATVANWGGGGTGGEGERVWGLLEPAPLLKAILVRLGPTSPKPCDLCSFSAHRQLWSLLKCRAGDFQEQFTHPSSAWCVSREWEPWGIVGWRCAAPRLNTVNRGFANVCWRAGDERRWQAVVLHNRSVGWGSPLRHKTFLARLPRVQHREFIVLDPGPRTAALALLLSE